MTSTQNLLNQTELNVWNPLNLVRETETAVIGILNRKSYI
jgi:hypothetical protein